MFGFIAFGKRTKKDIISICAFLTVNEASLFRGVSALSLFDNMYFVKGKLSLDRAVRPEFNISLIND